MKSMHEGFSAVWKMFNEVRKNDCDAGWDACVETAKKIMNEHPDKMFEKIILAVIEEAEAESKIKDKQKRNAQYRLSAKAFSSSWTLFESLMKTLDINTLHAYCVDNPGRLASKLSAAVYETACGAKNAQGSFMEDAFEFYQMFAKGITKENQKEAFKAAEMLVDAYPEHTLQVMSMLKDLKEIETKSVLVA